MRWFRFYDEVLDDPKVRRLPPALAWSWVLVLCAANRNDPRGTVPPLSDLAFLLRVNPQKAKATRDQLRDAGLLDENDDETFSVHGWNVRQREYDLSTPRTKTFRERYGNAPDTEEIQIQKQTQRRASSGVVRTPTEFSVDPTLVTRWQAVYLGIDVPAQIRAAFEWEQSHPERQKINIRGFLVNWLKREQDRVPAKSAPPAPIVKIRPAILDEPPPFSDDPVLGLVIHAVAAGKKM